MSEVVYCLAESPYDGEDVLAVFSTLESAQVAIDNVNWRPKKGLSGDWWMGTRWINEPEEQSLTYYAIYIYTLDPADLDFSD